MDNSVLDQHELYFSHLQEKIQEMKLLYQEKQWHQLTEALLKYIEDSNLLEGKNLIDLYNGFVKDFEGKIDQIKLMVFVSKMTKQFNNDKESLEFLEKLKNKVLKDEQALFLYNLQKGFNYLSMNDEETALNIIKDISKKVERLVNIDPLVYSNLYKLSATYYKSKENYEEFYKNSLQYLAYTSEHSLLTNEKISLSLEMGFSILISKTMYNFSELMQQPVLKALINTEHEWVYKLLETFNFGNVDQFKIDMKNFENVIKQHSLLPQNMKTLEEKIRIMALLELIFSLPKNDRNVSFEVVAKKTQINVNQVEMLIMRTMSLNLIKGSIDQINQIISISWITPRILDKERIQIMSDKINQWNCGLNDLLKTIHKQQDSIKN